MIEATAQKQQCVVSAIEPEEATGALIFTLVPMGPQRELIPARITKRIPQFTVAVQQTPEGLVLDWSGSMDDPGDCREEIEAEITARMKDRETWLHRITSLVSQVQQWVCEMGWSTRRVEKRLDDTHIGKHQVPALVMQQDTCRALLEPIGRSAPGAGGVADLYLMPAYDDIASLYYYDDRWNLHYNSLRGTSAVVPVPKSQALPLTKDALARVLAELRKHAA